jgi:hypothetical protein
LPFDDVVKSIVEAGEGVEGALAAALGPPILTTRKFAKLQVSMEVTSTPGFELFGDALGVELRGHHNVDVIGAAIDRMQSPTADLAMGRNGIRDDLSLRVVEREGISGHP